MKFFCLPSSLFACRAGPIDQLDFSQLRLEHVPREIIKSRKHIEELLLNVNSIEELPVDLFRCSKIRRLDVSENKIKVIPPDIGYLQSLIELNLSKNEIVEIPEEISLCHNLAHLDISTNIVTGFPKSFVNLAHLTSLNLSNNSLTQLPQDIHHLANLQFLDVAQCELRMLPPTIVHLERLRILDLCDNYLTELPAQMDRLVSLEMLDLHCNMIGHLPDELLRSRSLRTLDASGNQLTELPANIGDLQMLTELVLCENQIRQLPNSIGQLKRLEVLKASKNRLTSLTPSICSCGMLTDLILNENQLQEIPASIGNLGRLRFLDLNVNNLHSLPPTIGGCQSLGILSLRHNQLSELPMEIGKLNQLQVLDVADNNLRFLPYTLTVLYKARTLNALWLSFNQPPLPKLTTTHEPMMNIKVLTCYLLPQKSTEVEAMNRVPSKSCVGGARVCFAGDPSQAQDEDDKVPLGKFERYDTPHPKPFAPKNRHSRNSGDFSGLVAEQPPATKVQNQQQNTARNTPLDVVPLQPAEEESRPLRSVLKRRPQSVLSHISTPDLLTALLDGNGADVGEGMGPKTKRLVRKNIRVRKGAAGFEWTIIGGADSLPYKGKSGLFISNLVEGGTAMRAGFLIDDCLLAVNGTDLRGLGHQEAVQLIQTAKMENHQGDQQLDFLVEREQEDVRRASIPNLYAAQMEAEAANQSRSPPRPAERLCAMIVRNKCGLPGFTVTGAGRWPEDPFTIGRVDVAESTLRAGDRIISVGGTTVKFGARLDQVKTLLAGFPGTRVEVVVERGGEWPPAAPKLPPKRYSGVGAFGEMTLTRSLPSLLAPLNNGSQNGGGDIVAQQQLQPAGIQQQQQVQDVQNHHHFQRNPSLNRGKPTIAQQPMGMSQQQQSNAAGPAGCYAFPRPNLSLSNLTTAASENANAVTQEMLRASTPIEYPPGEEPGAFVSSVKEPPPKMEQKMHTPASTSFSTTVADHHHQQQKDSTSIQNCSFSPPPPLPPKMKSSEIQRPNNPRPMDHLSTRIEPPLAASSPVPKAMRMMEEQNNNNIIGSSSKKSSHIPISTTSPTTKIPPPVAPKPKVPNGIPSSATEHLHREPPPPSPTSASFSSKLKHFEEQGRLMHKSGAGGPNSAEINIGVIGVGGRPSGIPLKKPLVCAQDLEKMREAEERKRWQNGGRDEREEEEDEHRDTVHELTRLLSSTSMAMTEHHQNGGSPSTGSGPSIVRTKKAETRAAASSLDNSMDDERAASSSRASSSLSQRAAEIEKRREWRQARLQSMDVESKRTDDLVKLIAAATGTSATATPTASSTSTPQQSPIPIGP